ncbi:MAG TPA: tyrosine-protein phosphatase [Polyangia bacterium]|nr:tyrosine-protein phosphatase [Polyangia bacterium]
MSGGGNTFGSVRGVAVFVSPGAAVLNVAAATLILAACGAESGAAARDPRWAEPIEVAGLPNLHRVDDGLYRGAQPDPGGFAALRELGVRTVIDLRSSHSDLEVVRAAGLDPDAFDLVAIPMSPSGISDDEILAFLRVAADPARRPVFVHCRYGADRTGTTVAAYRVVVQGWTPEAAVAEMKDGGFGHHSIYRGLRQTVLVLDIERLRRELRR